MQDLLNRIKSKFNIEDVNQKTDKQVFFNARQIDTESVIMYLKEYEGYTYLLLISAVDYIEENEFQLTYILRNIKNHTDVAVNIRIDRETASQVSINELWAGAKVYEREIRELFGIDFPGCPRVEEPFVLESWDQMPPFRRDFDTKKYSEETYFQRPGRSTNDPTKTMEDKMYSNDALVKDKIKKMYRNTLPKEQRGEK